MVPADADDLVLRHQRAVLARVDPGLLNQQVGLQLVDAVLVLQDRRREVGEVFHFRNDGGAVGLNRVAGAEAPAISEARFPGLILALVERLMLGLYLSQGRRKAQSNEPNRGGFHLIYHTSFLLEI